MYDDARTNPEVTKTVDRGGLALWDNGTGSPATAGSIPRSAFIFLVGEMSVCTACVCGCSGSNRVVGGLVKAFALKPSFVYSPSALPAILAGV